MKIMKKSGDTKDAQKNTGIVSFRLNALAASIMLAFILDLIRSAVARPLKFEYFSRLPDLVVRDVITGFLNPVDKLSLALSYKENLRLVKPILGITNFQTCVARGEQSEAQRLLQESKTKDKRDNPNLLLAIEPFTDYSGRTFTCTAYEYAYWAKDRHMLRMLEAHMDESTKEVMSRRIDELEQQGLTYMQHGKTITGSRHFDITPLKTIYEDYIRIYTAWDQAGWEPPNYSNAVLVVRWMQVGKAQRDLPVHYVNEYFRRDRSFHPTPEFNESVLPRELTFYNMAFGRANERLFPLVLTPESGLGIDFAFVRGDLGEGNGAWGLGIGNHGSRRAGHIDLLAVCHLDEVRTNELIQSRKNLEPSTSIPGMSR